MAVAGSVLLMMNMNPLVFDLEFDTYVHKSCIRKALEEDPENPEAKLMEYLLEE